MSPVSPPLLPPLPQLLLLSVTLPYGLSLWSFWVSCPGNAPSPPLAHSQPTGFGAGGWQREGAVGVLMLCQHGSAVDKTHWCNIKSVLARSTEHSAAWAAVGKVESIPGRPRTPYPPWWGWYDQAGSRGVAGSPLKKSSGGCGKAAQPVTCEASAPCYELLGKARLFQNPLSPLDQRPRCARGSGLCQL